MSTRKKNKYGVAPKEERTWKGVVYASKAEMQYARQIHVDPTLRLLCRQPIIDLTEDDHYRPDFLVECDREVVAIEVKGRETPAWRRNRRLWKKYGPFPLHVVTRGRTVEIVTRET